MEVSNGESDINTMERVKLNAKDSAYQYPLGIYSETYNNPPYETLVVLVSNGNTQELAACLRKPAYQNAVDCTKSEGITLLHIAAQRKDYESMKLLLEAGANPNIADKRGKCPLHCTVDSGCRCKLCTQKRLKCIDLLVNGNANVNSEDEDERTPLYYAATFILPECAIMLLDRDADINRSTRYDESLAALLVQNVPEVMLREFDKCITVNRQDYSKLNVDFNILLQNNTLSQVFLEDEHGESSPKKSNMKRLSRSIKRPVLKPETGILHRMLHSNDPGSESLLLHPVTEAFLDLKWKAMRIFFTILKIFYILWCSLYTTVIVKIYLKNCPYKPSGMNHGESSKEIFGESLANYEPYCHPIDTWICGISFFVYGTSAIMAIQQFFKMREDSSYWKSGLSYLWWLLILSVCCSLTPVMDYAPFQWQYPIASFSLICAWAVTLAQLGRIPVFGVFVEMLGKVVQDFSMFMLTYSSLFIAFATGFYVLFPDHEMFQSIPLALVKVFLIMVGDMDYIRIFNYTGQDPRLSLPEYLIPANILYLVFVIVMTIILTSLMVGLAVSDIQDIRKKAELKRSIRLIQEIYHLESFLYKYRRFLCGMYNAMMRHFSISSLKIVHSKSIVTFAPANPDDTTFSSKLKSKFTPYLNLSPCINPDSVLRPMPMTMNSAKRSPEITRKVWPSSATTAKTSPGLLATRRSRVRVIHPKATDESYANLAYTLDSLMEQNKQMGQQIQKLNETMLRIQLRRTHSFS